MSVKAIPAKKGTRGRGFRSTKAGRNYYGRGAKAKAIAAEKKAGKKK